MLLFSGVYLNSLGKKILFCGSDDLVLILDLCLCLFVLLDLFFYLFWVGFVVLGVYIL